MADDEKMPLGESLVRGAPHLPTFLLDISGSKHTKEGLGRARRRAEAAAGANTPKQSELLLASTGIDGSLEGTGLP